MVKIRLKRIGMKKMPFYRVVVADSRFPAMAATSKKSATMIRVRTPPLSTSTTSALSTGSSAARSRPIPPACC